MKKLIKCFLIAIILPIAFICCGCVNTNENISIVDIKKTDSVGIVDTYTITYSNGDTNKFTIVNGKDGESLFNNITINDLYEQVKPSKPSGYTLIDFINEYLDIQIDSNAIASSKALRSAVSIFVEHDITIVDYNTVTGYSPVTGKTYGVKDSIAWGGGAGVIYNLDKERGNAYIITNYHVCFSMEANAEDGIATKFTAYVYGAESIDMADLYYLPYYNNENNNLNYSSKFKFDAKGKPIIDYGYGAVEAEYVGGSEQYDIAVLKVTGSEVLKNSDCLAIDVYNSDDVSAGSTAIAIGNPDAGGISVTNGVVSVDSEYISVKISDTAVTLREFRIDTPVNLGNSGGGLFDTFGRLVGIVNAKTKDTSAENMSYAIPSNIAIRVADSIIDMCDGTNRKIKRVFLGVTLQTVNSKGQYDADTGLIRTVETVQVEKLEINSLAGSIGQQVGDILVSVEIIKSDKIITIEIDRRYKLIDAMLLVREGDCIKFNYTRSGVSGSVTTTTLTEANFIDIK